MNNNIIKVNLSKVFIGIDLAKETHVAKAIDVNGELISTLSKLDNSIEGFQMFDDWVQNIIRDYNVTNVIIGVEPTGVYWQNIISYIITNMEHCEAVMTKQVKVQQIRSLYGNGKGKNDFIDALSIARCVKDGLYFKPRIRTEESNKLKRLSRFRDKLLKDLNRTHNILSGEIFNIFGDYKKVFSDWSCTSFLTILRKYPLPEDIANATDEELLTQLRTKVKSGVGLKKIKQLKKVTNEFLDNKTNNLFDVVGKELRNELQWYIEDYINITDKIEEINNELKELVLNMEYAENIIEIKGVAEGTVAALFAEVGDLKDFKTSAQLISFVGLDLKENSSGGKKGKRSISKCGSAKIRSILYKVAFPLITQNDYFKQLYKYYTQRKNNPLKGNPALIAICCKFLRVIYGMVKNNSKFDGNEVIKGIDIQIAA